MEWMGSSKRTGAIRLASSPSGELSRVVDPNREGGGGLTTVGQSKEPSDGGWRIVGDAQLQMHL